MGPPPTLPHTSSQTPSTSSRPPAYPLHKHRPTPPPILHLTRRPRPLRVGADPRRRGAGARRAHRRRVARAGRPPLGEPAPRHKQSRRRAAGAAPALRAAAADGVAACPWGMAATAAARGSFSSCGGQRERSGRGAWAGRDRLGALAVLLASGAIVNVAPLGTFLEGKRPNGWRRAALGCASACVRQRDRAVG